MDMMMCLLVERNEWMGGMINMNQDEYIKFLEERLKHSDEQLMNAMEMLAKLMSKMPVTPSDPAN